MGDNYETPHGRICKTTKTTCAHLEIDLFEGYFNGQVNPEMESSQKGQSPDKINAETLKVLYHCN